MFDRIAGVYDLMNSVMTAGMHHRWRERAADLPRSRPALARSTWPPAPATWPSSWPARGARVAAWTSPSGCWSSRVTRRPGSTSCRATRSSCPTPTARSTPPLSASGRATSPTSTAAWPRWRACHAPGGRVVILEITTPQQPAAVLVLPRSGSTASCPRWAEWPATRTPTATCRRACGAFPAPSSSPRGLAAAGLEQVCAGLRSRRRHHREGIAWGGGASPAVHRPPRHSSERCWRPGGQELAGLLERTEARLAEVAGGHGAELAGHAGGTLAAGGKRLRPMLVFLCANGDDDERLVAAAAAVELLHMATLVHDDVLDPRRCAAAGRRSSPRAAAWPPPPPATCCSRAPSPSWPRPAAATPCRRCPSASSALARGELMQRADAWSADVTPERYLERCRLKTASLFERLLPPGRAVRWSRRAGGCARPLR